jgi:hypothetical protein
MDNNAGDAHHNLRGLSKSRAYFVKSSIDKTDATTLLGAVWKRLVASSRSVGQAAGRKSIG